MSQHDGYTGAHITLAFLAGAAAGACAALLSAPQSGPETRETLSSWAREARGRAPRLPDALRNAYREATTAAKHAFAESLRDAEAREEEST